MRMYTLDDLAEALRCSPRHVRYLIADGKIATVDIGRGSGPVPWFESLIEN